MRACVRACVCVWGGGACVCVSAMVCVCVCTCVFVCALVFIARCDLHKERLWKRETTQSKSIESGIVNYVPWLWPLYIQQRR